MDSDRSPGEKTIGPGVPAKVAVSSKRAYVAPVLRVYGSVRQITLGGTGGSGDGQSTRGKPFGSDRSIKRNVLRIGTHPLGIGLYLFEYKADYREEGGEGRHFGVMADEVEAVIPQAVGRHPRGHKTVDYAMLGITTPGTGSH